MDVEKSVYRDGCPKCAAHDTEVSDLRAKLKAERARPTTVVKVNDDFCFWVLFIALAAALALGVAWIVAGSEPWVVRMAVVVAVLIALLGGVIWNGARVIRVLGKGGE